MQTVAGRFRSNRADFGVYRKGCQVFWLTLMFACAVDPLTARELPLGGTCQKTGNMLLGETDSPKPQTQTLDASFARPFQNGLFVDMKSGGNGVLVEQGRFCWIHDGIGSRAPHYPDAPQQVSTIHKSAAGLNSFYCLQDQ